MVYIKATSTPHSYEDAKAVVTIGEGKHYCLGLDLDYLGSASALEAMAFIDNLQQLLLRTLTFPLVTVAAINGKWEHFKQEWVNN